MTRSALAPAGCAQVYALTKERDALRKGAEKLADYSALIKEKDDIIKQVRGSGGCVVGWIPGVCGQRLT